MAYRGGDHADAALSAPTSEGTLEVRLHPRDLELVVGDRTLRIGKRTATLVERGKQEKRTTFDLGDSLFIARGFPREDLGIWMSLPGPAMRRIFGVEPVSMLDPAGLVSLRRLDALAQRLRAALGDRAGEVKRGMEIGAGHALDKVLLADYGDRYVVYARRLFRDRARLAMEIHGDGRIIVPTGKEPREVRVTSRFGVTVRGDYVRFADPNGTDLAKVSVPWIEPEDRQELARRIAQLIDRSA